MNSSAPTRVARWVLLVCVGILVSIWSSTWLVIKGGLADIPPFTGAGVRFLIAGIVMTVVAWRFAAREGGARPPWWLSGLLGSTNFAISYGVIYWAETVLPSGVVAVLYAIFPLLMAVSGHFFLPSERLHPRQFLGFVGAFLGVAFLFSADLAATGADTAKAAAITLISPFVSVIGNTAVKRHAGAVSSLRLNRDAMLIGAAWLLLAAAIFERDHRVVWSRDAVIGLLYLSLCGTVIAFGLYFWLLRQLPAARLSLIAFIIPLLALLIGASLDSEPITPKIAIGTGLILCGVLAARRAPRIATAPPKAGLTRG